MVLVYSPHRMTYSRAESVLAKLTLEEKVGSTPQIALATASLTSSPDQLACWLQFLGDCFDSSQGRPCAQSESRVLTSIISNNHTVLITPDLRWTEWSSRCNFPRRHHSRLLSRCLQCCVHVRCRPRIQDRCSSWRGDSYQGCQVSLWTNDVRAPPPSRRS